jgi:NDP-sugar pyrophosphorylase family protein
LHAVILAGGLGTRLQSVVADRPKPMALVGSRPFLHYLLVALERQGFDDVVVALGHRAEQVRDHFGTGSELGLRLRYSIEEEPLGTAGALKLAEDLIDADRFLLANGDSYLGADYQPLFDDLTKTSATGVLALHHTDEAGRYGAVETVEDGRVTSFVEKGEPPKRAGSSLINAGVYAFDRSLLGRIPAGEPASLERDVLPGLAAEGALYGRELAGPFIDIGVPHDYRRLEAGWRELFGGLVAE